MRGAPPRAERLVLRGSLADIQPPKKKRGLDTIPTRPRAARRPGWYRVEVPISMSFWVQADGPRAALDLVKAREYDLPVHVHRLRDGREATIHPYRPDQPHTPKVVDFEADR